MIWKKFNAMGTEMVISASLAEGRESVLDEAEETVRAFEKRFGRFSPDNELSRLNAAAAGTFTASRDMIDILIEAKRLHEETAGIFDPTIIGSLEKLGYAKSFSEIENGADPPDLDELRRTFRERPKMDELEILHGRMIMRPERFRIDLGGIGKGYIADLLGKGLFIDVPDVWISAGGDLFIKGSNENAHGWTVGVQDPHAPEKQAFSIKTGGEKLGIATSGVFKRRGENGGAAWHHLIDPRTGLSAENDIMAVTVIAPSATQADVFAKTVLILGEHEGIDFIDSREGSACVVFLKERGELFSKRAANYFGR